MTAPVPDAAPDPSEQAARVRDELVRAVDALAQNDDFLRGLPAHFAALGTPGARFDAQDLARTSGAALALGDRLRKSVDELRLALVRAESAGLSHLERIKRLSRPPRG